MCCNWYIYIVSHHSSREHRALTKFCHLTRFLASTLTSFHVLPWCLISSRIVLRHVVWGQPQGLWLICYTLYVWMNTFPMGASTSEMDSLTLPSEMRPRNSTHIAPDCTRWTTFMTWDLRSHGCGCENSLLLWREAVSLGEWLPVCQNMAVPLRGQEHSPGDSIISQKTWILNIKCGFSVQLQLCVDGSDKGYIIQDSELE